MYTAAQGVTGMSFDGHRIRSLDSLRRIQGAEIGGQPQGSNPGASFRGSGNHDNDNNNNSDLSNDELILEPSTPGTASLT